MKFSTTFAFSALYTASSYFGSVTAHGYVQDITIAGKTYPGWAPFDDPYKQPIPDRVTRKIKNDGPVTDWNSPDIVCNTGAPASAGITAEGKPGDDIVFKWQWVPGHKGPVTTMLAKCPNNDCTGFKGDSGAVWFMIQADGLIKPPNDSGDGGYWASDKLMDAGGKWTAKIPDGLEPGAYLMRHEILAMHSAGNPQFYPACTQLKVTGSGTKRPAAAELAALPGFYEKDKDSVLFNIYKTYSSYKIAGPKVVSFASGGSGGDPPSDPPAPTTTEETSSQTTEAPGGTTTKIATTTVKKPKGTASPSSSPIQSCRVTKKRSVNPQAKHRMERKRRLIDHNN